jgi:hypothetical protein
MLEIWKTIYINGEPTLYEVSNFGRVKSLKFNREKILKPVINRRRNGYLKVGLCYKSKTYTKTCHRLVAKYFLDNFDKSLQVNHKDFNTQNNRLDNLEWVTDSENKHHARINGLICRGEASPSAKLTSDEVRQIRFKYASGGVTQQRLSEIYNVGRKAITKIVQRQRWKHI